MKKSNKKITQGQSLKKLPKRRRFWIISFVIGLVLGASAVVAGVLFVSARGLSVNGVVVANVPVTTGYFYVLFGALMLLGSFLVFAKRMVLIGAVLILIPCILVGPQSLALYTPYGPDLYVLPLVLGWVLPIISFAFAIVSRKR